jgi:hypothetical protein
MARDANIRRLPSDARRFLDLKTRGVEGRARLLRRLTPATVGLRPIDRPYAPSAEHFRSANRRLAAIDHTVRQRLGEVRRLGRNEGSDDRLLALAMVERELDRARRAFGMFFEVFAQRGTAFARALAAHDTIARDCYTAVRRAAPQMFAGPLVPPLTYLEQGYSPATMRRGVTLARLLGERNPFPLIRIPYDRDQPWQAVFLHEVSHNLQADLGLWVENRNAVIHRLAEIGASALSTSIFGRWHKEIFADLAALLLGGPAAAWGMAAFLSHPADKVMTYRPGAPHPTGYLRVRLLAQMLERMGFPEEGKRLARVWTDLYDVRRGHRIPATLLRESPRVIPAVVDEIAFQPKRALSERALASVIPFTRADQALIRRAGLSLRNGQRLPAIPPRFLVCAALYAIEAGADMAQLHERMLDLLAPVPATSAAVLQTPTVSKPALAA